MKMLPYAIFALILAVCPAASAQGLQRQAPPEVDEALRTAVTAFYTHFQKGEFRQAEEYVDGQSKDAFYVARKNRILAHEISSINYADDFRSATALVTCRSVLPMLGSEPFDVPLSSTWRFNDGVWRMHLSASDGRDEKLRTPFGEMSFGEGGQAGGGIQQSPLSALRRMYQVSTDKIQLEKDKPSSSEVIVKNTGPTSLSVKPYGQVPGDFEIAFDKESVGPGEELKITITHKGAAGITRLAAKLNFEVSPIAQVFTVAVSF